MLRMQPALEGTSICEKKQLSISVKLIPTVFSTTCAFNDQRKSDEPKQWDSKELLTVKYFSCI